jgi:mRNA interferase RelE/StbE
MVYLIIYFFVGFFTVAIAIHRGLFNRRNWVASALTLLAWPLIVFAVWQQLFDSREPLKPRFEGAKRDLQKALETDSDLNESETQYVKSAIDHLEDDICEFAWYEDGKGALETFWRIELHPGLYREFIFRKRSIEESAEEGKEEAKPYYRLAGPEWYIGMTNEFIRSLRNVDKKTQGRILDALKDICDQPTAAKGDTIKPLSGDLNGLWRYRIGDYRLTYKPDLQSKHVLLLSFASRASAYR